MPNDKEDLKVIKHTTAELVETMPDIKVIAGEPGQQISFEHLVLISKMRNIYKRNEMLEWTCAENWSLEQLNAAIYTVDHSEQAQGCSSHKYQPTSALAWYTDVIVHAGCLCSVLERVAEVDEAESSENPHKLMNRRDDAILELGKAQKLIMSASNDMVCDREKCVEVNRQQHDFSHKRADLSNKLFDTLE